MGIFFGCHSSPVDGFHSYLVNWGRERGGGGRVHATWIALWMLWLEFYSFRCFGGENLLGFLLGWLVEE